MFKLSKPKIILRLKGGLGNQMFQYAAGRALAHEYGLPICLDISFFKNDYVYKREFSLDIFNFKVDKIVDVELLIVNRLRKKFRLNNGYIHIQEKEVGKEQKEIASNRKAGIANYTYKKLVIPKSKKDIYLNGFWQSENYFFLNRKIIKDDFSIKKPLLQEKEDELQHILCLTNPVCLGVRSYNEHVNASQHYKLDTYYYTKAIDFIKSKIDKPYFVVFTDDIKYSYEVLPKVDNIYFVKSLIDNSNSWQDLYLMTKFKYFIISNSTYHWWGAWLAGDDSVIIAPKLGWGNNKAIPERWIKI